MSIVHVDKIWVEIVKILRCGRPGGGGGWVVSVRDFGHSRSRREGGQNRANFCGRPLCAHGPSRAASLRCSGLPNSNMLCEGSDCLTLLLLGPAAVKRQPSRRPPREAWRREMGHNVRQGSERAADKLDNFDQSRHCYRRLIVKYQVKKLFFWIN